MLHSNSRQNVGQGEEKTDEDEHEDEKEMFKVREPQEVSSPWHPPSIISSHCLCLNITHIASARTLDRSHTHIRNHTSSLPIPTIRYSKFFFPPVVCLLRDSVISFNKKLYILSHRLPTAHSLFSSLSGLLSREPGLAGPLRCGISSTTHPSHKEPEHVLFFSCPPPRNGRVRYLFFLSPSSKKAAMPRPGF